MPHSATPRARLASLLIGRDVHAVIEEMRANGSTWGQIAQHIRDATDGEVDVTWQAIQAWARAHATAEENGDAA